MEIVVVEVWEDGWDAAAEAFGPVWQISIPDWPDTRIYVMRMPESEMATEGCFALTLGRKHIGFIHGRDCVMTETILSDREAGKEGGESMPNCKLAKAGGLFPSIDIRIGIAPKRLGTGIKMIRVPKADD